MNASLLARTAACLLAAAAGLLGAAWGQPLVGPAVAAIVLVGHVWTLRNPLRQLRPLFVIAVAGTAAESAWIAAGLYAPAGAMRGSLLCPLWITAMWLNAAVFMQGVLAKRVPLRLAAPMGAAVAVATALLADGVGAILVAWPLAVALLVLAAYGAVASPLAMRLIAAAEEPITAAAGPADPS